MQLVEKNYSSTLNGQEGATIVEFAFVALFMLLVFGAFTDIGLGIHRYALLKEVTTESTREISARLQTRRDCSEISEYLLTKANSKLKNGYGIQTTPTWQMTWDSAGATQFAVMRIRSEMPIQCFFLCSLLPKNWKVHSSSESLIDRSITGNGSGSCQEFTVS